MPFMLYDAQGTPGKEGYNFVRQVSLAGKSGPLATFARNSNPCKLIPFGWHATADDLIGLLRGTAGKHALVIDLKPRVAGQVSLYRLLDIWGFSREEWTPLALRLQALFVDHEANNPHAFKNSFIDSGTNHSLIGEFIYVRGGVSGGKWIWGMVGRVNGALLWKDAFEYLTEGLAKSL